MGVFAMLVTVGQVVGTLVNVVFAFAYLRRIRGQSRDATRQDPIAQRYLLTSVLVWIAVLGVQVVRDVGALVRAH